MTETEVQAEEAEPVAGEKSADVKEPPFPEMNRRIEALDPPRKLRAKVVHGFGRGSKVLGFPTANMEVKWDKQDSPEALTADEKNILDFARECRTGIYYAWAQVVDGQDQGVYKVAMSIGWNPTFTDVKAKTIEPWILHDFKEDFYDCELRVLVCGFVRPEVKFDHFPHLITAIREDGDFCRTALDSVLDLKEDSFFLQPAAATKEEEAAATSSPEVHKCVQPCTSLLQALALSVGLCRSKPAS
mmetsp:Transcript_36721/g.55418  ORF Transcript_36721/g.55418 Transcript_36721/m.55418 type:complete len:244 (-) Transcript_36721:51-782(-)